MGLFILSFFFYLLYLKRFFSINFEFLWYPYYPPLVWIPQWLGFLNFTFHPHKPPYFWIAQRLSPLNFILYLYHPLFVYTAKWLSLLTSKSKSPRSIPINCRDFSFYIVVVSVLYSFNVLYLSQPAAGTSRMCTSDTDLVRYQHFFLWKQNSMEENCMWNFTKHYIS
jgi:hypothetical protein